MFKSLANILVVITMLVAFFGQAMASSTALPCDTSLSIQTESLQSEIPTAINTTLNKQSTFSVSSSDDCCDIDCCALDCLCLASGCISFAYLNNGNIESKAIVFKEIIFIQPFQQTQAISSSLYRPPIVNS